MIRALTLLLTVFALSACATIFDGETQDVTVVTPGAKNAKCTLDNGAVLYNAFPPQTITIGKRGRALKVTCDAFGERRKTQIFAAETRTSSMINVANGLLPGLMVDYVSGAANNYPTEIVMDFTDIEPRMPARPGYHQNYLDYPTVAGVEEFRPGRSALIRDQYETAPVMQRRAFSDEQVSLFGGGAIIDAPVGAASDGFVGGTAPAEGGRRSDTFDELK